jgi:hypothetical protein
MDLTRRANHAATRNLMRTVAGEPSHANLLNGFKLIHMIICY